MEESDMDAIQSRRQSEEGRALRRTLADLEEKGENNKQAVEQILTSQNIMIQQLADIADTNNKAGEAKVKLETKNAGKYPTQRTNMKVLSYQKQPMNNTIRVRRQ
eukprot:GHVL01019085.1.p3 GENE.GHVL01019085.1~~GHVL01019085.1.p3  ORF type:complete len:105 (-),score=24.12 GHVL01019085.1:196-510(-)